MSLTSQTGSSKADTMIKVVLVFFISLLSFSVGTFVGHQFSKSEQRRLALEGEYKAERNVASTDAAEMEEKISEREVESLTEEFVNKEKAAAREPAEHDAAEGTAEPDDADGYKAYPRSKTEVAAQPAAEIVAPKTVEKTAEKAPVAKAPATKDAAHQAANKIANNKAPTDGMKETRKPSSALPAVANSAVGKYTVQVASYAEETEAKNHAATLKGKGWSAFYVPANVQGRTWYRVSVGIYDSNKAANEARAQFMKDTKTKVALVQKIVQ